MAIDLNTNGKELRESVDSLLSGRISWCVFGYSGQSNTLKVIETGSDSIEEMFEEFNGSKVMYGYAKVLDPNSGLPKYIFINWVGSGAPDSVKFNCSQHVKDVQRFCKTVHVTVNARNEQDLSVDDVMQKVAKASGANYSIHQEKPQPATPQGKVGSSYQPVKPTSELSNELREAYWSQVDSEERQRREAERQRLMQEKAKTEADRRELAEREAASLAKMEAQRIATIAKQRSFERQCEQNSGVKQQSSEALESAQEDEERRRHRADSLRHERQAEVSKLIQARRSSNTTESSQNVGTAYRKVDPIAEIKAYRVVGDEDVEPNDSVGTNYSRVNPRAELARARSISTEDDNTGAKVGSVYKRPDPKSEIARARNISQENDDFEQKVGTNYRRTDPKAEIMAAKRMSTEEESTLTKTSTGYKRVDPKAEIEAAKSYGADNGYGQHQVASVYKKTDAASEINLFRRLSGARLTNTGEGEGNAEETAGALRYRGPSEAAAATGRRLSSGQQLFHRQQQQYAQELHPQQPEHDDEVQPASPPATITPAVHHQQHQQQLLQYRQQQHHPPQQKQEARHSDAIGDEQVTKRNSASSNPALGDVPRSPTGNKTGPGQHQPTESAQLSGVPATFPTRTPVTPPSPNLGVTAIALYDYEASEQDEVSFAMGEQLIRIDTIDEGWWVGENGRGQRGMFPANYVKMN